MVVDLVLLIGWIGCWLCWLAVSANARPGTNWAMPMSEEAGRDLVTTGRYQPRC